MAKKGKKTTYAKKVEETVNEETTSRKEEKNSTPTHHTGHRPGARGPLSHVVFIHTRPSARARRVFGIESATGVEHTP